MIGYAYTGLMGVEVGSVGLVYGLGEGAAVYENPRIQQNIWLNGTLTVAEKNFW